ncbi:MAG: protein kinase [Verrucomicrobiota bacterium]
MTCSSCGGVLPSGGKPGLCPKCLFLVSCGDGDEENEEPLENSQDEELPWARLGDYDIYDEIAHGGMGIVYRARQRRLGRVVAVKVLRGGELAEKEARLRFRMEAEAAGKLHHPGVVAIFDVGEDHGVCWFSMEYVPGENLAQRVRDNPLEAMEAARCLERIASAIQHAHDHRVLHRDLKPSNILMGVEDQPMVTDFGLARKLESLSTLSGTGPLTRTGQTLGSPGYVSPEQALHGDADPRSDVYGLGAVLYHALTGRAPFVGPTLDSILLQLRETEPVAPRRLNPTVPRDLETICLKCLEKSPARRYATAADVVEDLKRFQRGETLKARPVSKFGKAVRWCRRRPGLAGMAAAFLLAALGGTLGIFHQWRRAENTAVQEYGQRMQALASGRSVRLRHYAANMYAASQALLAEDMGQAERLLEPWRPVEGGEDFRGPEWFWLKHRTESQDTAVLEGHPWIVACLAISPDGRWLASGGRFVNGWGSEQTTLFVWDPVTRRRVYDFPLDMGSVKSLQFTPDGTRLMMVAAGRARFFRTGSWEETGPQVPATFACLAHEKPWLAVAGPGEGAVLVYDTGTGQEIRRLPVEGSACAFLPGDRSLAVMSGLGGVKILDLEGHEAPRDYPTPHLLNAIAISPDGHWLGAVGGPEPLVWDLTLPQGHAPRRFTGHRLDVKGVIFSRDSQRLITTGSDRTIRYWNVDNGLPAGTMRGHRDEVWCAGMDPQERWLVTGGKDATVRLWPASPPSEPVWPEQSANRPVLWSADSKRMLLVHQDLKTVIIDPVTRSVCAPLPQWGDAAAPGGLWVRLMENPTRLEYFDDTGNGVRVRNLEGNPTPFRDVNRKVWSRDGSRFCLVLPERQVGVWDTATGKKVGIFPRPAGGNWLPAVLSADGRQLALAGSSAAVVRLYRPDTGGMRDLVGHSAPITTVAFSPDGRQLASAGVDATIRLWDTATGSLQAVLRGHIQDVDCVEYSPDGRTLASLGNFEALRLWNVETASEVTTLPLPLGAYWVSFSPDGAWLAVNQGDSSQRANPELERVLLFPTGPHPEGD